MYSSRAFKNIDEIIAIGEEETRKNIDTIHQFIKQWKEHPTT